MIKSLFRKRKEYKVGFALSGGGARGVAHLGVLRALEEKGIRPNIISGTSSGALAGALYADGVSSEDILSFFDHKSIRKLTSFKIPTKGGLLKNDNLKSLLKEYLHSQTFEDLKIPMRVVATDIERGKSKIFSSGELMPALIASCSIPLVFEPMHIHSSYYVDGALLKNFPVTVIRDICDTVVGVNVSPIVSEVYKESLRYVAERAFHYMVNSNILVDRSLCNFLIEYPQFGEYSMFDFDKLREIYQVGYDKCVEYLENNKEDLQKSFSRWV